MSAIITSSFRFLQADQFRSAFDPSGDNTIYLGVGKPTPWADELTPDAPADSSSYNTADFRELLMIKRLTNSDSCLVFPRVNWSSGTVYASYDDGDADLFTKNFYVITDQNNVYKCIKKTSPTLQSTIKPTGIPTSGYVVTGDGYTWKYMYTVPSALATEFLTPLWIPVKRITSDADNPSSNQYAVQTNATPGTIDDIIILNGGTGYSSPVISITGDGSGATATATVVGGAISTITVTNAGSGYTWAEITISDVGAAFQGRAIISPKLGHGSNAASELGAYFVLTSGKLEYDEDGKLTGNNEYRKILLIQNPALYGSSTIATASAYTCTRKLIFNAFTGTFTRDEKIEGVTSGAIGTVVDYNTSTNEIFIINTSGTFTVGENILGENSGAIGTTLITDTNPEIEPNSGTIIYKDYRRAVVRDPEQTETIKIVVEF